MSASQTAPCQRGETRRLFGKMRRKTTTITNCGIHSQFIAQATQSTAGNDPGAAMTPTATYSSARSCNAGQDGERDDQPSDAVAGAMRQDDGPDRGAGHAEDGRETAKAPGIEG